MLLELGEAVGARRDGSRGVSLLASLPLQQLLLLQRWHNQGNDAAQKLNQMLFCCWALREPAQSPQAARWWCNLPAVLAQRSWELSTGLSISPQHSRV